MHLNNHEPLGVLLKSTANGHPSCEMGQQRSSSHKEMLVLRPRRAPGWGLKRPIRPGQAQGGANHRVADDPPSLAPPCRGGGGRACGSGRTGCSVIQAFIPLTLDHVPGDEVPGHHVRRGRHDDDRQAEHEATARCRLHQRDCEADPGSTRSSSGRARRRAYRALRFPALYITKEKDAQFDQFIARIDVIEKASGFTVVSTASKNGSDNWFWLERPAPVPPATRACPREARALIRPSHRCAAR